jgi:cytidine deaminase
LAKFQDIAEFYHARRMGNEETAQWRPLIEAAIRASYSAYREYSKFYVGAAVLTEKGNVYTGGNAETAAYLGTHAEENAIDTAIAHEGPGTKIVRIAVWGPARTVSSCGNCRQKIVEHGPDAEVAFAMDDGWAVINASDALPISFELGDWDPSSQPTTGANNEPTPMADVIRLQSVLFEHGQTTLRDLKKLSGLAPHAFSLALVEGVSNGWIVTGVSPRLKDVAANLTEMGRDAVRAYVHELQKEEAQHARPARPSTTTEVG